MSVDEPPAATVVGFACSITSGAWEVTVTVADCEAEPPGPVQTIPNSVLLVSVLLVQLPLTGTGPCQPPFPEHCVASAVVQVSVVVPEPVMVVGDAARLITGACALVTTT